MAGKRFFLALVVILCFCAGSIGNDTEERFNTQPLRRRFGLEFTAYPAGQIYGLRAEFLNRNGWELNLRLGYNRAFRKNFSGLNDDEQGGGPGASVGHAITYTT